MFLEQLSLGIQRHDRCDDQQGPPDHFLGQEYSSAEGYIPSEEPICPGCEQDVVIVLPATDIGPISLHDAFVEASEIEKEQF